MSRLARVIAPMLRAAGLDIREIGRADGQIRELVVTNPRYPAWGRVVIDREGLMEWDYWGHIADDAGAAEHCGTRSAPMPASPARPPRTAPPHGAVRTFFTPSRAARWREPPRPRPGAAACGLFGPTAAPVRPRKTSSQP